MTKAAHGAAAGLNGRVLVVCTGNVCRSPYMERRLAQMLGGAGIEVVSGGTRALVDEQIDPGSSALLTELGARVDGFSARQLTTQVVGSADLVLTAARSHRAEVVQLNPRALRYAFTWADFGQLMTGLDPARIGLPEVGRTWVAHVAAVAAALRGSVPPRTKEEADIVDPFRQAPDVFAAMAREIEVDLTTIAAILTPPHARGT